MKNWKNQTKRESKTLPGELDGFTWTLSHAFHRKVPPDLKQNG